jgi:hypothetical protein
MPKRTIRNYQIFFVALGIFCIAAIATNLIVRRVPTHDATIESDLTAISNAVDYYVSTQSSLPAKLSDVSGLSPATQKRLSDYEYAPNIGYSYQLCATFLGTDLSTAKPYVVPNGSPDPSRHGAGRTCFQYTAQTINNLPSGQPVPQAQ